MTMTTCTLIIALLMMPVAAPQEGPSCETLTDKVGSEMTRYVRALTKLAAETTLDLTRSALEGDTCYRRLEFTVGGQSTTLTLYLSPDQRFLSPKLFDVHVDPADIENVEASRISGEIDSYLATHSRPTMGEQNAPTTIVVFSDFQCPFCKKALQMLTHEIFEKAAGRVRIAYVQFPLASHSWARQAAESAGCLQDPLTFWKVEEFLFDHQSEINSSNLPIRISDYLASSSVTEGSLKEYKSCLGSKEAARQVDDDVAFGQALEVSATPTLFINGQRLVGLKNAAEVQRLIPSGRAAK